MKNLFLTKNHNFKSNLQIAKISNLRLTPDWIGSVRVESGRFSDFEIGKKNFVVKIYIIKIFALGRVGLACAQSGRILDFHDPVRTF